MSRRCKAEWSEAHTERRERVLFERSRPREVRGALPLAVREADDTPEAGFAIDAASAVECAGGTGAHNSRRRDRIWPPSVRGGCASDPPVSSGNWSRGTRALGAVAAAPRRGRPHLHFPAPLRHKLHRHHRRQADAERVASCGTNRRAQVRISIKALR